MRINMDIRDDSWSNERTVSLSAKSMFYYIKSVGHFFCNQDYDTNRKDYNAMLILITLNGKGSIQYNNQFYTLEKNQGFIINCNDIHHYKTYEKEWEFLYIHFDGSESIEYIKQIVQNNGFVFETKEDSCILNNFYKINALLKDTDIKADAYCSCLILEMLTEILVASYHDQSDTEKMPYHIKDFINDVKNNYFTKLSLDDSIKKSYVSKSYFIRQFKKYIGQSPYEYLMNYRLNEAKKLLKNTDLPVYEIALKVGFENASYFVNYFRQKENTTPLKFRNYWM